jgi:16S rRNA (cytosine967-C5)-methyltransferase
MKDKPREKALDVLCRTEEGALADAVLDRARAGFDPRDKAFILELVYGVLRNRAWLDWVLDQFSAQPLAKTDIRTRNILRLAAYQMLFLDKVPVSAAVNTATELAKEHGRKSGYVNGLLRSLDRKRSSVKEPPADDPVKGLSILYSHPAWLVRRWVERFGTEKTERILRENNRPSPLTIRTNSLRTTRGDLKASLEREGAIVAESAWSPAGLQIQSAPPLRSLSAYEKGWFIVQDEAAQLVGMMVAPEPAQRVLDAAAAPGGKATHLAELMKNSGLIMALEIDPGRIAKIEENSSRLGTSIVKPVLGDAAKFHEGRFDRILADAPCSGLGVLRRHPDGRWNKSEETVRERSALQRSILENCASLLKPGGVLVYATCTTEPDENEDVVKGFLAGQRGAFSIDDPRPFLPDAAQRFVDEHGFFRTFPLEPAMDGFFGVRLIKKI